MLALLVGPVLVQGAALLVDETVYHRRRGLPRWERIGHPLDTLTLVACLAWLVAARPGTTALAVYLGLCVFSTLFVTKAPAASAPTSASGSSGPPSSATPATLASADPVRFWVSARSAAGSSRPGCPPC